MMMNEKRLATLTDILQQQTSVFQQVFTQQTDQLEPFIWTDLLIDEAAHRKQAFLHFWTLPKAVIFGMKDSRLPHFLAATAELQQNGYALVLRNSGGLAVIADAGIQNISCILPNTACDQLTIQAAYEWMVAWIETTLKPYTSAIVTAEVQDSYCPGKYDLSIDGKKFAGLAQRRLAGGVAIMAYISVNGDQQQRGTDIRNFYQTAFASSHQPTDYPAVNPASMGTLNDLLKLNWQLTDLNEQLSSGWQKLTGSNLQPEDWHTLAQKPEIQEKIAKKRAAMQLRNLIFSEGK